MTTEELKDLIIEKQDNLIKMFVKIIYKNYDKFSVSDDSKGIIIKLEDNIADLNQQLKQSESKLVKQPTEIKEKHNCKNCYYELITRQYNPCDICSDFDKWKSKTEQL